MSKIFRIHEPGPRSFSVYERVHLDEIAVGAQEAEGIDPEALRERVLAEARMEAQQKVQEAYAEGLRRGAEAGKSQFLAQVSQAAEALHASSEAIRAARDNYLGTLEPQMLELVGEVARRILHRESRTDPDLIARTVRAALEHLVERETVVIHVNPEDADALKEQKIALLEEFDGVRQISVMPDAEIPRGGCVVETEHVHADARIDAQLERILDALLEGSEHTPVEESRDNT